MKRVQTESRIRWRQIVFALVVMTILGTVLVIVGYLATTNEWHPVVTVLSNEHSVIVEFSESLVMATSTELVNKDDEVRLGASEESKSGFIVLESRHRK